MTVLPECGATAVLGFSCGKGLVWGDKGLGQEAESSALQDEAPGAGPAPVFAALERPANGSIWVPASPHAKSGRDGT